MLRHDWECLVCLQPNSADDEECISCGYPYECTPNELAYRRDAYANSSSSESLQVSADAAKAIQEEPIVPSTKYLLIFSPVPTLYSSTLVFASIYLAMMTITIPLALAFEPNMTSSLCYGTITAGAVAVSEYWKRCNMLPLLRKEKWTMIWNCFGVILIFDFLSFIFSIDLWNVQFLSSVLGQKFGHIVLLWMSFGTNWLVSTKSTESMG